MIRLQKLLAAAGLGSRRTIEEWIRAGRVTVGGRVARLGDRAASADDVRLDGVQLDLQAGEPAAIHDARRYVDLLVVGVGDGDAVRLPPSDRVPGGILVGLREPG